MISVAVRTGVRMNSQTDEDGEAEQRTPSIR